MQTLSPLLFYILGGCNVTDYFLETVGFGDLSESLAEQNAQYVNSERLNELRQLQSENFDFTRLIRLCEELNDNYSRNNFLSSAMIVRTILNHIPPVFGFKTFKEVASNYGGASFKGSMQSLLLSMKHISDGCLHETIRRKESLPNETQIDFSQNVDVLLAEIIRIAK